MPLENAARNAGFDKIKAIFTRMEIRKTLAKCKCFFASERTSTVKIYIVYRLFGIKLSSEFFAIFLRRTAVLVLKQFIKLRAVFKSDYYRDFGYA